MANLTIQQQDNEMRALLSSSAGIAYVYQNAFGWEIKFNQWNVDLSEGVILLDNLTFPIQILGTQAEESWLWAYANPGSFPEALTERSQEMAHLIAAETNNSITGDELFLSEFVNGHALSSIATAKSSIPCCYYRCPFNASVSAFVVLYGLPSSVVSPPKAAELGEALLQSVNFYALDHKILVESTLSHFCKNAVWESETTFIATSSDHQLIRVVFDEQARIQTVKTELLQ